MPTIVSSETPEPSIVVADIAVIPMAPIPTSDTDYYFSPGDSGIISFDLVNTYINSATINTETYQSQETYQQATKPVASVDPFSASPTPEDVDKPAYSYSKTTNRYEIPNIFIKTVSIDSQKDIRVDSEPYHDAGLLAPGSKLRFAFPFKIDANASEGTYMVSLHVTTDHSSAVLNFRVPVVVVCRQAWVILEDAPGSLSADYRDIKIRILNPTPDTITSVSVVAYGEGLEFNPMSEKYVDDWISPGHSDTVKLKVRAVKDMSEYDIAFVVIYQSGGLWHHDMIPDSTLCFGHAPVESKAAGPHNDNTSLLIVSVLVVLISAALAGVYFLMRRKRKNE